MGVNGRLDRPSMPSETTQMRNDLAPLDQRPLPSRINRLGELAYNLWWSWHEDAQELFRLIDPLLWEHSSHNPVAFLRRVDDAKVELASQDVSYVAIYNRIFRAFDAYINDTDIWYATQYPALQNQVIAYFSTEFGLHESLPVYAGGLGVLSGDHAKEASDLGLPFVGMGLLYHKGYFTQRINIDGWQEDIYEDFDPLDRPIQLVRGPQGDPVRIRLVLGSLEIASQLWKVQAGRVSIFLLDTALESSNPPLTADITRLYGGSHTTRLLQEILLGIGGVRALRQLDINPAVWHMNEGHSAFLTVELVRERLSKGSVLEEAIEWVGSTTVFTTHTPVPAGLDMFDLDLLAPYFQNYCDEIGITQDMLLNLGRQDVGWGEKFSMPRLALTLSSRRNAVSKVHGRVSRELFQHIWPGHAIEDVPISHITNGIHAQTWLSPLMADVFDEYVGHDWINYIDDPNLWSAVDAIPDDVLWNVRQELKRSLLAFLRQQAQIRWASGESTPTHIAWSGTLFGQDILTVGFARRFATYKRATLLFQNIEHLQHLIANAEQPVQFIFAGKSHPQDHGGKTLIQEICRSALSPQLGGRIAFIENYDMNVARYLVRGVDVWLNNPRRPREASGTSGQKAALNGVPNLSVLDGWWAEGYNGRNGWAIGDGNIYSAEEEEDRQDAEDLYRVLEYEVIPIYYQRNQNGLPHAWLAKVREAIKSAAPFFTTRRMVKEYAERMYLPSLQQHQPDKPAASGR